MKMRRHLKQKRELKTRTDNLLKNPSHGYEELRQGKYTSKMMSNVGQRNAEGNTEIWREEEVDAGPTRKDN